MDSKHRSIFYFLFIIVIGILIYITFFKKSDNHLDNALLSLDSAQKRLDIAVLKIADSKKTIDSMRVDFVNFQNQIDLMGSDVQQLNINTKTSERRFRSTLDEIKLRNQQVVDQLKIRSDTLAPIKIY